jgi:hypothetical protein
MDAVERVRSELDETIATSVLLADSKDEERYFILEIGILWVATYLANKFLSAYVDGLTEGLEIKELGKKNGRWVKELWEGRRDLGKDKEASAATLDAAQRDADATSAAVASKPISEDATRRAEAEIQSALEQAGLTKKKAGAVARNVAQQVLAG